MGKLFIAAILLTYLPSLAHAHGRMLDPPSRMSAWRFGFDVFKNYNDNAQFCGGFANQWNVNDGKCGICGDPWQGPRDYERPRGKYVQKVVITRTYQTGSVIDVDVEVTANHLGWFEFRLCDVRDSGGIEATLPCFNRHLLADRTGRTQFDIGTQIGNIRFKLRLPPGLTCPLCVMQWKWHCGNNVGYGERQEEFYACSDITITSDGREIVTTAPITMPPYIKTIPTIPPRPVIPTNPPRPVIPTNPPYIRTNPPVIVTQPTRKVTYPVPHYTTPHFATLPPEVLAILSDKTRPLSQRIRYYVMYQQTHTPGYSVWNANQVTYIPRENSNNNRFKVNYIFGSNNVNPIVKPNTNTRTNTNTNTNNNQYQQLKFNNNNYIFSRNNNNYNNNNYNNNNNNNNNNNAVQTINTNARSNTNYQVNTGTGSNAVFCQACAVGCYYAGCYTSCPSVCPRGR